MPVATQPLKRRAEAASPLKRAGGAVPTFIIWLWVVTQPLPVGYLRLAGGRVELAFPYFVRKIAPVSGVASLLDYDLRLTAEISGGRFASTIGVAVPVTSLCPCSKEISEYGAQIDR